MAGSQLWSFLVWRTSGKTSCILPHFLVVISLYLWAHRRWVRCLCSFVLCTLEWRVQSGLIHTVNWGRLGWMVVMFRVLMLLLLILITIILLMRLVLTTGLLNSRVVVTSNVPTAEQLLVDTPSTVTFYSALRTRSLSCYNQLPGFNMTVIFIWQQFIDLSLGSKFRCTARFSAACWRRCITHELDL